MSGNKHPINSNALVLIYLCIIPLSKLVSREYCHNNKPGGGESSLSIIMEGHKVMRQRLAFLDAPLNRKDDHAWNIT